MSFLVCLFRESVRNKNNITRLILFTLISFLVTFGPNRTVMGICLGTAFKEAPRLCVAHGTDLIGEYFQTASVNFQGQTSLIK